MSQKHVGFTVLKGGVQSTIQDSGRIGFCDIGLTQSGAMDETAFGYANKLAGNAFNTPVVEIALGGLALISTCKQTVAITGADMHPTLNSEPIGMWQTHRLEKDDVIRFGFASKGQFAYLSVAGGFKTPFAYGSFSTSVKEGLGGIDGRKLIEGDFLPTQGKCLSLKRRLPSVLIPSYSDEAVLRVVKGYQEALFDARAHETFFTTTYRYKGEGDRMGYRLCGEKIVPSVTGILSEPICYGAIQIPSHGEPIVLLKERQTIGGYPKIGSVIAVDCFKLAQLNAGGSIRFQSVTPEEARAEALAFRARFTF